MVNDYYERKRPLEGTELHVVDFQGNDYNGGNRVLTDNINEATVISSRLVDQSNPVVGGPKHKVILDIDHEARLIPSSTPGHYHLYIDVEINQADYFEMLYHMAKAGVVQEGYARASERRGYTSARLPWIKK